MIATSARAELLARASGLDLASYRADHVAERIRRALERESVPDEVALARRLRADPAARERFRRSVAVSVSGLFRDPEQFELLELEVLPSLLASGRRLTVWSAGCADGTELYTVALLLERLEALDRALLLGSDVLEENIARARAGAAVDEATAARFRSRLRWEQRDIVRDGPPAGKWSLVLCRNFAIYLAAEARERLHASIVGALALGGVLLLGRSERLADPGRLGLERAGSHAYRRRA